MESHPERPEHIHFVTGRLAEHALRQILATLAQQAGIRYTVDVLPITVAALMTTDWIFDRWNPPPEADRILLPGYCLGELDRLNAAANRPVLRGPIDLRELPAFFSQPPTSDDYGTYDIEILAEINHAPRLTRADLLVAAQALRQAGADVIDVGCEPGSTWGGVFDAVRALRDAGHRVSIDTFNPDEARGAVRAGAELVLSVRSDNCSQAVDWGVEVVAIPDVPDDWASLDRTIETLTRQGTPFRLDPILEPIGFGFAASLGRYLETRRRYPDAPMLMGVGNLTELTDVDSAGVNVLLLAFCQEVGVRSVLTTQVINWARTSVRECDVARRLARYAVENRVLPKRLDRRLVMLRDPQIVGATGDEIAALAAALRDKNYRIFATEGEVHLAASGLHLHDVDPFAVMQQLATSGPEGKPPRNWTPSHAFYLGYELAKAETAAMLGKTYRQDEPLDWGLAAARPRERRHSPAPSPP